MANFHVQIPGLIDTEDELQAVTMAIQRELDLLVTRVRAYQAANDGAAIDNYTVAQAKWNEGTDEMRLAAGAATVALGDIRNGYVRGDNQGAMEFGSL